MKGIRSCAVALILLSGVLFAFKAQAADTVVFKGVIVDNISADEHSGEIPFFLKGYSKTDAIKNAFSGYALYADGKVYKFDPPGCAKIEDYLKKDDASLQVTVTAEVYDDVLSIVSFSKQG